MRPTADPGLAERTVGIGEEIELDGSASRGQIDSYEWDFGDGSPVALGAVVSHAYSSEGDFSASLTVKGPHGAHSAPVLIHVGAGCTAQASIVVTTLDPQPGLPVVFNGTGSTGCKGAPLVQFDWSFGDGEVLTGGAGQANVMHTYAASGTYQVSLRVADASGAEGRSTRTLNVGVISAKPVVTCPSSISATSGIPATFTASASDPAGRAIVSYTWTFSGGATLNGSSVQYTFAAAGSYTASVTATTEDARTSDACTTQVTVAPPADYSGTWVINPSSTSLSGCTQFSVGFPASTLALTHSGASLAATPSGNGWPSGYALSGTEDPPPAAPGTFRVRQTLPNVTQGDCGSLVPEHSVRLTFTSGHTLSGTWSVIYTASCLPLCSALCNCVASGDFTGQKQ